MNRFLTCLVLAYALLNLSFEGKGESINWRTTLETAMDSSKLIGKPIIIYFGANWCAPCKMTEKIVFSDPEFIKFSKKYLMVKIYDDLKEGDTIKYRYQNKIKSIYEVEAIPTFIVLNKNHKPCKIVGSYYNTEKLIQEIKKCL